MLYDQEGVKESKQTVASRELATSDDSRAIVNIGSEPPDAEIEIDGAFLGNTPRTKNLPPGEYKIKLLKKGYKGWERKIAVEAGETITVHAELETK